MTTIILVVYSIALTGLASFGLLGFVTLYFYWRYRNNYPIKPIQTEDNFWPSVTIQLPIFNERYVVKRLILAAAALNYPKHKLQIQIVDDSTDETTQIAEKLTAQFQAQGFNIELIHRSQRTGFKAGALQAALKEAVGEYIAIFDADFKPQASFLKNTLPYFAENENLGMIQTRWGHLNDSQSSLTAAQSIAMDKHFVIDQVVRHRADFFPKFNGTAGIWRRSCILDAGGWQDDTVCEDLCLSTRAILKGWDFQFLNNVVTPGELPTSISAYKNQQARWAKGSMQCLRRFGRDILVDQQHTFMARIYALLAMAGYLAHPSLVLLILLQIPLILLGYPLPPKLFLFSIIGLSQPVLFILSQQLIYTNWRRRLRYIPTLILLTVGLSPSITRAVLQTYTQTQHLFVRTPKGDVTRTQQKSLARTLDGYRLPFDKIILVEIFLALYAMIGLGMALWQGIWGPIFLLTVSSIGFIYISYLSMQD